MCVCTSLYACVQVYVCVCEQGSACTTTSALLHEITHSLLLTKLWVEFDAFLAVAQSQTELSQLCITRGSITEHLRIGRVPLDRLCVMTNRCWVVAYNTNSRSLKTCVCATLSHTELILRHIQQYNRFREYLHVLHNASILQCLLHLVTCRVSHIPKFYNV